MECNLALCLACVCSTRPDASDSSRYFTFTIRMPDIQMKDGPPEGLFFTGSDNEDDEMVNIPSNDGVPPSSPSSTAPTTAFHSSPPREPLFLPEDEEDVSSLPCPMILEPDPDVRHHGPAKSSLENSPAGKRPRTLTPQTEGPTFKKQRQSTPPLDGIPMKSFPAYIGDHIVPNAWSTVSGKGYISLNDSIRIRRDAEEEEVPKDKKTGKGITGKQANGGKKQATLTSMIKKPSAKPGVKKQKRDTIVRLVNSKGFGKSIIDIQPLLSKSFL